MSVKKSFQTDPHHQHAPRCTQKKELFYIDCHDRHQVMSSNIVRLSTGTDRLKALLATEGRTAENKDKRCFVGVQSEVPNLLDYASYIS